MHKIISIFIFSFSILAFVAQAQPLKDFPAATAKIGKATLSSLYVAGTDPLRQRGLMGVKKLSDDEGMLFVFETARPLQFWMKNTFIPLSIGFFDAQGCLLEVQDMEPVRSVLEMNIPRYQSSSDAQFALEANRGWFKQRGIQANSPLVVTKGLGSKVLFDPPVKKALERLLAPNRCKVKTKN